MELLLLCKIVLSVCLLTIIDAKPVDLPREGDFKLQNSRLGAEELSGPSVSSIDSDDSKVYLILTERVDDSKPMREDEHAFIAAPKIGQVMLEKRSAKETEDLETAAGTNVLRPLFVYRQQLAYRERVKKGANIRRLGIRPRL